MAEAGVPGERWSTKNGASDCALRVECQAESAAPPASISKRREQQSSLKKLPLALEVLQEVVGVDTPLRYFCQDESRWGLLTLNGRVITLAGVKPEGVLPVGDGSTFLALWSLRTPDRGTLFLSSTTTFNSENFEQFIHQFAARYPDEVIVIQMDQSQCPSRLTRLIWPENIIPRCFQPALHP